jgi:hypothetical protein
MLELLETIPKISSCPEKLDRKFICKKCGIEFLSGINRRIKICANCRKYCRTCKRCGAFVVATRKTKFCEQCIIRNPGGTKWF